MNFICQMSISKFYWIIATLIHFLLPMAALGYNAVWSSYNRHPQAQYEPVQGKLVDL